MVYTAHYPCIWVACSCSLIMDHKSLVTYYRSGTIGATRAAIATPHFGPPSNKMVEPRYVSTSDSLSHVMVSAVLAINTILTDTKKEGVVFWTRSHMQTEGVVFWTRY